MAEELSVEQIKATMESVRELARQMSSLTEINWVEFRYDADEDKLKVELRPWGDHDHILQVMDLCERLGFEAKVVRANPSFPNKGDGTKKLSTRATLDEDIGDGFTLGMWASDLQDFACKLIGHETKKVPIWECTGDVKGASD